MHFSNAAVLLPLAGSVVAQAPRGKQGGLGNLAGLISDIPMTGPIFLVRTSLLVELANTQR